MIKSLYAGKSIKTTSLIVLIVSILAINWSQAIYGQQRIQPDSRSNNSNKSSDSEHQYWAVFYLIANVERKTLTDKTFDKNSAKDLLAVSINILKETADGKKKKAITLFEKLYGSGSFKQTISTDRYMLELHYLCQEKIAQRKDEIANLSQELNGSDNKIQNIANAIEEIARIIDLIAKAQTPDTINTNLESYKKAQENLHNIGSAAGLELSFDTPEFNEWMKPVTQDEFLSAANSGDLEKIKRGIKQGVDINTRGTDSYVDFCGGGRTYSKGESIFESSKDKRLGSPALIRAAKAEHVEIVRFLSEQPDIKIDAHAVLKMHFDTPQDPTPSKTEEVGQRAVHAGCHSKEILEILLNHGANPNPMKEDTGACAKSTTPVLICAAANCKNDIVDLLLSQKDININIDFATSTGPSGKAISSITALGSAAKEGCFDVVKTLSADKRTDVNKWHPLQEAVYYGKSEDTQLKIAETIINNPRFNFNSEKNQEALVRAAEKGRASIVELLLQKGINKKLQAMPWYTIIWGDTGNSEKVMELFLKEKTSEKGKALKINSTPPQGISSHNKSPIEEAAERNKWHLVGLLKNPSLLEAASEGDLRLVKLNIEKFNADVDAKDSTNKPTLQLAQENKHSKIVDYLKDISLLKAAETGNLDLAQRAVNAGANINIADKEGKTPLHYVAMLKLPSAPKIAQLLIDHKAQEIQDKSGYVWGGYTPRQLAQKIGNKEVLTILERAEAKV